MPAPPALILSARVPCGINMILTGGVAECKQGVGHVGGVHLGEGSNRSTLGEGSNRSTLGEGSNRSTLGGGGQTGAHWGGGGGVHWGGEGRGTLKSLLPVVLAQLPAHHLGIVWQTLCFLQHKRRPFSGFVCSSTGYPVQSHPP